MNSQMLPLTLILVFVFVVLAFWHIYMAVKPAAGVNGAVPSVDGKPLFVPSAGATVAVALLLLALACLVAATGGIISLPVPRAALTWLSYALAIGLLARAIGDFKYVGFFKRVRGSRFATLDYFAFSPLCVLLAVGVALVAWRSAT
jgi:hypothetical protein